MTPEELRETIVQKILERWGPPVVGNERHLGRVIVRQRAGAEAIADDTLSVVREAMREPSGTLLLAMNVALGTDTAEITIKDIPRIVRLNDAYLAALSHSPLREPKP